jgi:hypothetical protein
VKPVAKPRVRISIQSAKGKGRRLQQEVRDIILDNFKMLEPDDVKSTSMGSGGEDVMLSPLARKTLGGIQIECKRVKTFKTVYNWIKQAKSHGPHKPLVVVRADREESLAILPLSDYIAMIRSDR